MAAQTLIWDQPGLSTWTCPPGVTSLSLAWVIAGGGTPGSRTTTGAEAGAGGGEYAAETNPAVTPGKTYAILVSAAAAAGVAGATMSMVLDAVTITAHGGGAPAANSTTPGAGGTGSTNGTHHNGGAGAAGTTGVNGGGGGSSAGSGAVGGAASGATGGTAPTGGGNGGAGHSGSTLGNGSPGVAPGGGGGGGLRLTTGTGTGGAGAVGQIGMTYTYNPGIVGGINTGEAYATTLLGMTGPQIATQMALMVTAGAKYFAIDSNWTSGTTVPGTYDALIAPAQTAGLTVVVQLKDISGGSTGSWGTGAGSFSAWCTNAATHYKALGVNIYEIGNEVNLGANWTSGTSSATTFTACMQAAYTNIKAVDASATVLFSGLSAAGQPTGAIQGANWNPLDFLYACYAAGVAGSFDAMNLHPYCYTDFGNGLTDGGFPVEALPYNAWYLLDQFYYMMVANGDGAKKIWLTEFGVPTGTDAGLTAYTQNQQAVSLAEAFAICAAKSYVGPLFSFSWLDSTGDGDFGLYTSGGVAKTALAIFEAGTAGTYSAPAAPPYNEYVYDNAVDATATTITVTTIDHSVSTANTLVLVVSNQTGVAGVATSTGDTWVLASSSSDHFHQLFVCANPTAGAKSVTVNFSGGTSASITASLIELAGKYTFDAATYNLTPTTNTVWTTNSVTPAGAGDVFLAQGFGLDGPDQVAVTGLPRTLHGGLNLDYPIMGVSLYAPPSGSAAQTGTFASNVTDTYTAAIWALKPTAVPITAASTATLTGSAALAVQVPLVAASTATLTGVAALAVKVPVTAAATATLTGAAALQVGVAIGASTTATLTGAAVLAVKVPITAASTATLTGTAVLAVNTPVSASATATLTGTAALVVTANIPITAAGTLTLTGTAVLVVTANVALTASATATLTGTAVLQVKVPVTAAATATLTGTAVLQVNGSGPTPPGGPGYPILGAVPPVGVVVDPIRVL